MSRLRPVQQPSWRLVLRSQTETEPERTAMGAGPTCLPSVCSKAKIGVLNEGIIGNRLLHDSPKGADNPFGAGLGQAGLARFERDVLTQAGVRYVIVGLGINDILFPAFPFTPQHEQVSAEDIISGYRQLIARGHRQGIRVIGTTNPPFENSAFEGLVATFYTPDREATRQKVNDWIR